MGHYQDFTPAKAADGQNDTKFWSNQALNPGDYIQIDLSSARPIGRIKIQMGPQDGQNRDIMEHAKLQYSTNGQDWKDLGTYNNQGVITKVLEQPVKARYLRLSATQHQNSWLQVREFQAATAITEVASSATARNGHDAQMAFDHDATTYFQAEGNTAANSTLTHTLTNPSSTKQVAVIGDVAGTLEGKVGKEWVTLGQLEAGKAFQQFATDDKGILSAVRLKFAAADRAYTVNDIIVSNAKPTDLKAVPLTLGCNATPLPVPAEDEPPTVPAEPRDPSMTKPEQPDTTVNKVVLEHAPRPLIPMFRDVAAAATRI